MILKKIILLALTLMACISLSHAQIPSYVPTNGLVGWWPFNGNANDESGNNNNGTVNGATLTADRFGNPNSAYVFDGISNQIVVPHSSSLSITNNLTISIWFKVGNYPTDGFEHYFLSKQYSYGPMQQGIHAAFSDYGNMDILFFRYRAGDFSNWGGPSTPYSNLPSPGSWFHVVFCSDGTSDFLYANGVLLGQYASQIIGANSESLHLGGHSIPVGDAKRFAGSLDDIGIWNRALSPCEVSSLYFTQLQVYTSSDTIATCSSYTWPITGQTYTQSGTYTDTLQSVQGCDSIVGLELTILQATSLTLTESACGSYTLNGQTYTQSGNYTQTLVNAAGCDSVITLNLSITNLAASVSFAGGTLTASPVGATYQWVNCEQGYQPIVGSTGQTYTPDSTGNYAVVVTAGPCTDTSACTSVVVVGTENGLQQVISLYPNPTDGLLNVAGLPEGSKYLLMDAQGRKIMKGSGSGSLTLELAHLPAGVYTLSVEAPGSKLHRKVVVE